MTAQLAARLAAAAARLAHAQRPFVTLSFAQSLDGSIAAEPGKRLRLSSPESLQLTHQLRAAHDAILVGIGTVLADDPRLSVRLVNGPNPQPVVLDSRLRCPLAARLLQAGAMAPWIITGLHADALCQQALEAAGAHLQRVPTDPQGHVRLEAVLATLAGMGIRSVMVEGGAAVITNFMEARAVDYMVVTVAPVLVGGVSYLRRPTGHAQQGFPRLRDVYCHTLGEDLIVEGEPVWPEH